MSIPAVCIDVDGVIRRGNNPIPFARNAILKFRQHKIPIAIMTNGGGETEAKRARYYSRLLNLPSNEKFHQDEIVLCHSPMKPNLKKYNSSLMVITGNGKIQDVMKSYGYNNFITAEEYAQIFPEIFPFFFDIKRTKDDIMKTRRKVENRIGRSLATYPKVSAIIQLADLNKWELNMQLFSDLLISPDGIPGKVLPKNSPQKVDYHLACLDLLYMDRFTIPRFACGSFFFCLQYLFKKKYGREIKFYDYGKPSPIIYNFAKKEILKRNRKVNSFYMIGDNPEVDIKGANKSGFHSILVRTGIFKGENSKLFPANKVVNNVNDAADYIISRKGMKH